MAVVDTQRRTGYGKKAKRRIKLLKLIELYPDRADSYYPIIESLERDLRAASTCLLCGRKLTDAPSRELGIGNECRKKQESHDDEAEDRSGH